MKLMLACLLLTAMVCHFGHAQAPPPKTLVGSVFTGLTYTQPYGGFRKNYPGGHGLGGTMGFTIRPYAGYAPVEIGTQIGYLPYGIEKHLIGSGNNSYSLKTTHSLVPLHALVRLKPRRITSFTPYLDGLAGITVFNSRTKIKEDLFTSLRDEEAVVVSKHTSTVFNYGLGAGLSFGINNRKSFFGEVRLIYLESPLTRYVKKGNVLIDQNGDASYLFTRSETSMFMLQLNLTGIFKSPEEFTGTTETRK